jgi:hypothetical protein
MSFTSPPLEQRTFNWKCAAALSSAHASERLLRVRCSCRKQPWCLPDPTHEAQGVANHSTIAVARIVVKKPGPQKENRAKSQSPGFNIWYVG